VAEDFLGAVEDGFWEAGESCDLDAVGFIGWAGEDLAEEDNVFVPLSHGDVEVSDGVLGFGEGAEFVVVSGKEGAASDLIVEVLGDGPRDGEAIEGSGAAANFIEDDEALFGCVIDDEGGLIHLDHEGGLAFGEIIGGSDAAENAVGEADVGVLSRDVGTDLGHEGDEGDLANVGRFTGHVGAGEDLETGVYGIDEGVVWDELFIDESLLQNGVAAVDNLEMTGLIQDGAGVLVKLCCFREADEDVERSEGVGGRLKGDEVVGDVGAEFDELVVFEGLGSVIGSEDFAFHFLQAGCDEALGVGHRLLALVVIGGLVGL